MNVVKNTYKSAVAYEPEVFDSLRELIQHAAHLLPAQGPITAFVHHNTLHAFEDLPFHEAVQQGGRLFGCQPYLPEDDYREMLQQDRIRVTDLEEVLLEDLGERADGLIGRLGTRFHLRLAMLRQPLRQAPGAELQWLVAESEALRRFRPEVPERTGNRLVEESRHWVMRDLQNGNRKLTPANARHREKLSDLWDHFGRASIESWSRDTWESFCLHAMWRACRYGMLAASHAPRGETSRAVRHRDYLLQATGQDSDRLAHELLIRLCAAFLDQGFAHWNLPQRERGLYQAFLALYRRGGGPPDRWLRGLPAELAGLAEAGVGPLESIAASLDDLGVEPHERLRFVTETLLALRGWAGMIWQSEIRGDRVVHPAPAGSLVEFVAVRLLLERHALAFVAREQLGFRGPLRELRGVAGAQVHQRSEPHVEQRAFSAFQLAQVLGWSPQFLFELSSSDWSRLVKELEGFPSLDRRRVFHEAYERRYRIEALDAVSICAERAAPPPQATPQYQVICCIDEREESFRRHLEEIEPECETLGAAGFYGVAMYYCGAADAHFAPLCPPIVRPQHYVREDVVYTFEEAHRRRAKTRRAIAAASHQVHVGSRTFAGGAFLAALLGPLASIPLVARVLSPRLTARICRLFEGFVRTPPVTQLQLERREPESGPENGNLGYTLCEMAGVVERLLRDMGLTSGFAPLVVVTGHGSSSLNNPHEAAHDCGACGGARGGPNARAFAQMANDSRVRALVAEKGLDLPESVYFVGAYHNTCDDSVTYFDLERLPATHRDLFTRVRNDVDEARLRSAHERCRRFASAPLNLPLDAALRHVEGRAEDLAQTRPEYGHATNALCFVGRRWKNRGLFLDRRAFLTSYDPLQDDGEHTILTRILQAVVPVCAGISLEYYFSFVDPTGYGCGTKLPHNVTSLLGVMDGAASDLRPGLPWQMVEIHEPVRLLFIIETTPRAMLEIMDHNEVIGKLCRNEWVQIATQDPQTAEIHVFHKGGFALHQFESQELPVVKSSIDWYRGWRKHLGFASVAMDRNASGGNGHVAVIRRI